MKRVNEVRRRSGTCAWLLLALGAIVSASPLGAQGRLRELFCRGGGSSRVTVDQDPSPRDTASVVMVFQYQRAATKVGNDIRGLLPGTCTWNPLGSSDVPAEPGRVRFDVRREAQAWSATGTRVMDTTVRAAVFFPDPITLPRYLGDASRYWKFFLDDQTNLSWSYGALFESGTPTYVTIKGPLVLVNDARRDLLCRGGSAGLRFGGGGIVGNNLAKVVLAYRASVTVPGPVGYGLSPGSCAWTDRTAMPKEPGTIAFVTARNAQIKQAQSGSIDRSPTAAERYPDVFTIPEYLKDPQHYWTFRVMSKTPDSALTNGPWKRDLTNVVATGRSAATPTSVTLPGTTGPGNQVFRPGGAGSTSVVQAVYDITNVIVSPTLDNLIIGFQAAPNIAPVVTVTPAAGGSPTQVPVQGSAQGTMWRYVGSSKTPLARNTRYSYRIDAPASANARANSTTGTFKTLGQDVSVAFTELTVISDGDASGDGELHFKIASCPSLGPAYDLQTQFGSSMVYKEGVKYRLTAPVFTSQGGSAPDKFRVLVYAWEDDRGAEDLGAAYQKAPGIPNCGSQPFDILPSFNDDGEWNSIAIDFDLSTLPGTKAGTQFIRRSKPLTWNTRVMFEIRGSVLVTRQ